MINIKRISGFSFLFEKILYFYKMLYKAIYNKKIIAKYYLFNFWF